MSLNQHTATKAIRVAGDTTVDWMLVAPTVASLDALQSSYQWESRAPIEIIAQPGGASLVRALIDAASRHALDQPARVFGAAIPPAALHDPENDTFTRTYTIWQPYPARTDARDLVWRMHAFLGVRPAGTAAKTHPAQDELVADCLVIDDANLGFRDRTDSWPPCLRDGENPPLQIIIKMSNPLATGPLWQRLVSAFPDALTVYCSVGDLRKEYAPIGQPLSWERMGSDVARAIQRRADLSAAARVVVSLGMSGAVIIERDGSSTLVYDPVNQEGDWERARPGMPVGLGACVTAALTIAAARSPESPNWLYAVRAGLDAGRALHERRFVQSEGGQEDGPRFPLEMVATVVAQGRNDSCFEEVVVPDDADWHIFSSAATEGYRTMAARIVVEGDQQACHNLPIERIGAWASIDRTEIESMRSVRNIIREHLLQSRRGRPLSLAVFGPPGSGKSFAIKQMAREWMGGMAKIAVLEFNLSQFAAPDDLPAALQRVRDCAVEGTLPLVFWDEFDTALGGRELGWLARFLAPMQDGTFVEDGLVRPVGPAIFIFAGGTHPTMTSFKARAVDVSGAKATDFLSRLRGYVDILGPNPTRADDRTYVLRRALLLRTLLQQKAPGLVHGGRLDIDPGVLRALLDVTTYVHGARSMESIVDMSALSGKLRYERSALPPQHQLGLHVDALEFLNLVHSQREEATRL